MLAGYVQENLPRMSEEEGLAVLSNRHCTTAIVAEIASSPRLTAHDSIRIRLVEHRSTPQGQALRFINYLRWPDLLRLSVSMLVLPPVRRAIDIRLGALLPELTLGEKIAAAKRCSRDLITRLMFDPDPRVFSAVLINPRLVEDDLVRLIAFERVEVDKLIQIANDRKWSLRYAIRLALLTNEKTPRAIAARQLRYLTRRDLGQILESPSTSVYLRRCIERMDSEESSSERFPPP